MNDQDSMSPIKFTSPVEILSNENYIHEYQDTKFKRTISKELFKKFKKFELRLEQKFH